MLFLVPVLGTMMCICQRKRLDEAKEHPSSQVLDERWGDFFGMRVKQGELMRAEHTTLVQCGCAMSPFYALAHSLYPKIQSSPCHNQVKKHSCRYRDVHYLDPTLSQPARISSTPLSTGSGAARPRPQTSVRPSQSSIKIPPVS